MATTNETLLLKIGIDNSEAVNRLAEQKKQLEALRQEKKILDKTDKDYQANLVLLDRAIKQVNDSIRIQERELDNVVKSTLAAEGSNEQLRAELSLLTSQYNKLSAEERDNTKSGKELEAQIKSISDTLKNNETAIGDNRRNVGNYADTISGMRARLVELRSELENTEIGSDKFNELNGEIENLSLSIGQATGKLNEFGEKEPTNKLKKGIGDAFVATTMFSNGLQTLNSVYGENTTLAEANTKAIQAIAFTQTAANIAKEKGAIIDTVANAKTIALTASQKLYAIAVGTSTGAMKVFRLALAATGVGALVFLLTELIFNFDNVRNIVKDVSNWFKNFLKDTLGLSDGMVDFIDTLLSVIFPIKGLIEVIGLVSDAFSRFELDIEGLNKQLDANNAMIEKNMAAYEKQYNLMKAAGANEKELAVARRQIIQEEIRLRDLQIQKADELRNKLIEVNGSLTEEEQKLYDSVKSTYDNALYNLQVFEAEQNTIRRNEAKKRAEEARADLEKYLELVNQYNLELLEDEEARAQSMLVMQREAALKEIEQLKISETQKLTLRNQIQANFERQSLAITEQFAAQRQKASDDAAKKDLDNTIAWYNQQIQLINQAEEIEVLRAENTAKSVEEAELRKTEAKLKSLQLQLKMVEQLAQADGIVSLEELNNITILEEKIKSVQATLSKAKDSDSIPSFADLLGIKDEELEGIIGGVNMVMDAVNGFFDLYQQRIEQQQQEVDNRYNAEIAAVERLTISEEEKTEKIKQIEKKAAQEKYELELKAFRASQAMQVTNAIIQTAMAVIAAYTSAAAIPVAGVALAPIMAAVAGALGAAQIAVIASQPPPQPPQFFDGGFTEQSGNPYLESKYSNNRRGLHHDEYVTPARVLRTKEGQYHVGKLEALRQGIKDTGITPSGYFSGGMTSGMTPSDVAAIVDSTVSKANIVVRVTDISNKQNAQRVSTNTATVR